MKIIVGLGNPEKKYFLNRHNVGFLFLDYLKEKYNFPNFLSDKKKNILTTNKIINEEKVFLVKPLTYMNNSGESILKLKSFYKLQNQDFLVIYDDKDLNFKKFKYKENSSSGGHNGIKSIIKHLGTIFPRIKIGVSNSLLSKQETADFVLSNFNSTEKQELNNVFNEILETYQIF
jgi:PTH1 family peptidyl-tRNA hydrolase